MKIGIEKNLHIFYNISYEKRRKLLEIHIERMTHYMKKKLLTGILIGISAVGMLGGCGGAKEETQAQTEASESSEEEADQLSTAQDSGDVHLTIWTGAADEELMQTVIDNFIKEHEGEANFTIDWAPMEEGDCRSALLGDVLNGPDVYTTTDGDIQTIVAGGAASPVVNSSAVSADNLEAAVESLTIEGKLYGYPLTADNGYFLYYNKAYFSEDDIKNFNGMLDIAAANGKKVAMDWSSGWYLYSFFGQTGLKVGLNEDGVTNFCDWNSTENAIKGVDVASALLTIGTHPGFASMVNTDYIAGVQNGSVIACVSGVWDETAIKNAWGSDYGASALPKYDCNGQSVQMASCFGYKMAGVNPYSEHLAWAHEFANYMTNEENQNLRFEVRGQGPANIKAGESVASQNALAIQAVLAQSQYSELQRLGGNYWSGSAFLGNTMAAGNPNGISLQDLMDKTVEQITSSTVQ